MPCLWGIFFKISLSLCEILPGLWINILNCHKYMYARLSIGATPSSKESLSFSISQALFEQGLIFFSHKLSRLNQALEFNFLASILFRQRDKSKQTDGSPLALFNYFVDRTREMLHIVLAMSPIGDAFRNRLRKFPSLVNCCTIDWFQVSEQGWKKYWHHWSQNI